MDKVGVQSGGNSLGLQPEAPVTQQRVEAANAIIGRKVDVGFMPDEPLRPRQGPENDL